MGVKVGSPGQGQGASSDVAPGAPNLHSFIQQTLIEWLQARGRDNLHLPC